MGTPSTSAAVRVHATRWQAVGRLPAHRVRHVLPRDGLGYSGITAATCPWCAARDADRVEVLTLYRSPAARWVRAALAPPVVFGAAALLRATSLAFAGELLFTLGPAVAIALTGGDWSWGAKAVRTRVSACTSCGARLADLTAQEARWRRTKHVAALLLLGLCPLLLASNPWATDGWRFVLPGMVLGGVLELAAWWGEGRARALQERILPRLLDVDAHGATVEIPGEWVPLLDAATPR